PAEFGLELIALADIERDQVIGGRQLVKQDRDLAAVRRRPIIEIQHRCFLRRGPRHASSTARHPVSFNSAATRSRGSPWRDRNSCWSHCRHLTWYLNVSWA